MRAHVEQQPFKRFYFHSDYSHGLWQGSWPGHELASHLVVFREEGIKLCSNRNKPSGRCLFYPACFYPEAYYFSFHWLPICSGGDLNTIPDFQSA